jgi:hypothetical protein
MFESPGEGGRVEVRRRFDAEWARGFEVAEVNDQGVLVRRLSDGAVLPATFSPDDIRPERERRANNMWWM